MDSRGDSNDTEVSSIRSVFFNTTPHTLATAVREVSRQQSEEMSGDVATSMLPEDPSSATFWEDRFRRRDPLYIVIPITIVYGLIFFTGLVGNVSTCIVIAKNKHMHTATNYYLFNLAISDLLLLLSGLPAEMYGTWSPTPYVFGEAFCVIQSFAAETSANATVLTITAFTVERYVAICHPLRSHTLSGLSRALKLVVATWVLAVFLAVPQVFQFGIVYFRDRDGVPIKETAQCMMKHEYAKHAFAISTCVFFVAPMSVITVLYVLIGLRLRRSRMMMRRSSGGSMRSEERRQGWRSSQNHVIRMLVAVVVAFFICWAPFHAQRLLAVYLDSKQLPSKAVATVYSTMTYVSGFLYFLSTTINPLLYHIMSLKFKEAFKETLVNHCGWRKYTINKNHLQHSGRRIMRMHHEHNTSSTSLQVLSGRQVSIQDKLRRDLTDGHCESIVRGTRVRAISLKCSKSGTLSHSHIFPGDKPQQSISKFPQDSIAIAEMSNHSKRLASPGTHFPIHSSLLYTSPEGSLSSEESTPYLHVGGSFDGAVILGGCVSEGIPKCASPVETSLKGTIDVV